MILNVNYTTDSDMGIFESEAQLDLSTGKLIGIVTVCDENAEFIDQIYATYVSFVYKNQQYVYDVDPYEDYILDFKDTLIYKFISSEKLLSNLMEELHGEQSKDFRVKI